MKLRVDLDKFNPERGTEDPNRWFHRYELFIRSQRTPAPAVAPVVDDNGAPVAEMDDIEIIYLRYLPLYLAGSAILCFEELPEEEQEVYQIVKARLCQMFELDPSVAFERFVTSRYAGEGVDIFVAKLRRYVSLIGLPRLSCDRLLVEQFLRSIPPDAARELRVISRAEGSLYLDLSTLITNARHLATLQPNQQTELIGAVASTPVAAPAANGKPNRPRNPPTNSSAPQTSGGSSRAAKKVACFACGGEHRMMDCPLMQRLQSLQGNAGGPSWPAASRTGPTAQPAQH